MGHHPWFTTVVFYCSDKDHIKNQVGENRVSFIVFFYITGKIRAGTQGRKLKAGIEAEAMGDIALLLRSAWLAQLASSQHLGCQPREGAAHSELGPLKPYQS